MDAQCISNTTRVCLKALEKHFFLLAPYASKFAYSSLSCILRPGLQGVNSEVSCCSSTCCCCLQRIDALFQFDDLGLSICKLLRTAVKITRETWKPLAFSTCDALCNELF